MQFLVRLNFIFQAGAARCIRSELELAELTQNKKLCRSAERSEEKENITRETPEQPPARKVKPPRTNWT